VKRPRLFAELFAGTASTTLRLVGGPRMRPPVVRGVQLDLLGAA
jgi:hypothetical protein